MTYKTADEVVKFIIDIYKKKESDNPLLLSFHGGEPLLGFEILEYIVKKIKCFEYKTIFMMTTNATLLDIKKIRYLKENNFKLSVSLDGDKKTNDLNRLDQNNNGTFDIVLEKIKLLKEENINFTIRATFNSKNVDSLNQNMIFLYSLEPESINISPDYYDVGWTEDKILILEEQIKKNIDFIKENNNDSKEIEVALTKKSEIKPKGTCSGGVDTFSIMPNGDLYPCTIICNVPEFDIGNVFAGINKEKVENLLELYKMPLSDCEGCELTSLCIATRCKYINYKATKDCLKPMTNLCRIYSTIALILLQFGISS